MSRKWWLILIATCAVFAATVTFCMAEELEDGETLQQEQARQDQALTSREGESYVNYLVYGEWPSKGTRLRLRGMEVAEAVPHGYLIRMYADFAGDGSGYGRYTFLRSGRLYADHERLRTSAVCTGRLAQYRDVTGATRTVVELREEK